MASVQMLDHLVKVNGLEEVMVRHGLTLPDDLTFIKEQIAGPPDNSISDRSVCVCVCVCVCVTVISCCLVYVTTKHRLTSTSHSRFCRALMLLFKKIYIKVKIMWL